VVSVAKSFRKRQVVEDVSLDLRRGEAADQITAGGWRDIR